MAESKKIRWSSAWAEARELVWAHRRRLMVGAILMIVNQAMGLVLPGVYQIPNRRGDWKGPN